MTEQTTVHKLNEVSAEILAPIVAAKDIRNVKTILNQPLVITTAVAFGISSKGFLVSAYLLEEPTKLFTVRVYSKQVLAVLASILENDLLPMGCQFSKKGGQFILAE